MKATAYNRFLSFCLLSLVGILAFGQSEKKIQIFRNGEVIQEYLTSDIDYIEINDLILAPEDVDASVSDNQITVTWNAVEGATYRIYRSPDNVNFTLLATGLEITSYTDDAPLQGTNYYKIKAIVGDTESNYTSSVAASLTAPKLGSGIYLGITGFNQYLYNYPMLRLTGSSVGGFRNFIDGLTMKDGTVLYYSVDQALNMLQSAELPSDVSTIAMVTFTDGLDEGSLYKPDVPYYEDDIEYLETLNGRIKNETVSGKPITAFSIGLRAQNVTNINKFNNNLLNLASSPENATEVTNMAEVNAKFKEIAEMLSQSNYIQKISLKVPGKANGTVFRFTFDNVNSADKSTLYIEGTFNRKECSLENVKYVGMTSTSGTTIKGVVDDIFMSFTFEGVHTNNNVLVKSEFIDEWYIDDSMWQINSEFDKDENSDVVTERSSAAIMLILDCSSSLADDFIKAQNNAKDFINTLYQAVGSSDTPGGNEPTIYSKVPADLSVAIWKDGERYYLTPEQYQNANLTNATVEGLTVLSNLGNFIISPNLLQSYNVYNDCAITYYSDRLPDKDQATVISARYIDINNALNSLEWKQFPTTENWHYMTKTVSESNSDYNYTINLYNYTGGKLNTSRSGLIRGVKAIEDNPIIWKDKRNLTLAVKKDGVRYFLSDPNEDLTQYDEVEGIAVVVDSWSKFIISLHNEQSGTVSKSAAMSLYSDILPDYIQANIISMMYYDINRALTKFGGDEFSTSGGSYITKTSYNTNYNYGIDLYNYTGGKLSTSCSSGYIRGVKSLDGWD